MARLQHWDQSAEKHFQRADVARRKRVDKLQGVDTFEDRWKGQNRIEEALEEENRKPSRPVSDKPSRDI
jgi:hypothetical protein